MIRKPDGKGAQPVGAISTKRHGVQERRHPGHMADKSPGTARIRHACGAAGSLVALPTGVPGSSFSFEVAEIQAVGTQEQETHRLCWLSTGLRLGRSEHGGPCEPETEQGSQSR